MVPDAIEFTRYRCFKDSQRIDLRPITLIYGRNNSGKSAIARLVPILAALASPANEVGALAPASPAARKARFRDLFHQGFMANMEFALHWSRDGEPCVARYAFIEQDGRSLLARLTITDGAGAVRLTATWAGLAGGAYDIKSRALSYMLRVDNDETFSAVVAFRGLYPDLDASTAPEPARTSLHRLAGRLRAFAESVQWLQASRPQPERSVRAIDGNVVRIDVTGLDAAAVVYARRDVGAYVADWYLRRAGVTLAVDRVGDNVVCRVGFAAPSDAAGYTSDLIDTGEGMIQVLPVVTAMGLLAHRAEGDPSILVIEEPESHLHPDLQLALADDLCRLASRPDAGVLLLETHSEPFLLGVQRAVLRGDLEGATIDPSRASLPRDALALYWTSLDSATGVSRARPVELDREARLGAEWPSGTFDEITEVADELFVMRQRVGRAT